MIRYKLDSFTVSHKTDPEGSWVLFEDVGKERGKAYKKGRQKGRNSERIKQNSIDEPRVCQCSGCEIFRQKQPCNQFTHRLEIESVECICEDRRQEHANLAVGGWWICPAHGYKKL